MINYDRYKLSQYNLQISDNSEKVLLFNTFSGSVCRLETEATLVEYYYDQRGRLIRENNYESNFTAIYSYIADGVQLTTDNNNLYSKKRYSICTPGQDTPTGTVTTLSYTYGNSTFKDRLTQFNGQTISYDSMGNPTSYKGNTVTWNGRQMTRYGANYYAYDVEGMRKSKTANNVVTKYVYLGSRLISETKSNNTILYVYSDDDLVGFMYNNTNYFYIRNLQGDVTNVVNASGSIVATYKYDAWGKVLSASGSMANVNPIRYRGYYYDTETNLYYLNSRYYDPETGRFISPDVIAEGGNLYAYCQNDPVNRVDESGCLSQKANKIIKGFAIAAVVVTAVVAVAVTAGGAGAVAVGVATVALGAATSGLVGGLMNEAEGEEFANGWVGGAVSGISQSIGTLAFGVAGTIVGGGIGSGLGTGITMSLNNNNKDKSEQLSAHTIVKTSLVSAAVGTVTSCITAFMNSGLNAAAKPNSIYNNIASVFTVNHSSAKKIMDSVVGGYNPRTPRDNPEFEKGLYHYHSNATATIPIKNHGGLQPRSPYLFFVNKGA